MVFGTRVLKYSVLRPPGLELRPRIKIMGSILAIMKDAHRMLYGDSIMVTAKALMEDRWPFDLLEILTGAQTRCISGHG